MPRQRSATDDIREISTDAIDRALTASANAGTMSAFYRIVDMRNPSRSYYLQHGGRLHSLKAVATYALRESNSNAIAGDFHAADAAERLSKLGYEVVHKPSDVSTDQELD